MVTEIGVATGNEEILDYFRACLDGEVYLDKDGIREEMKKWTYPLQFIDFDTKFGASPPRLTAKNPVVFSEHHHPKMLKTL